MSRLDLDLHLEVAVLHGVVFKPQKERVGILLGKVVKLE